MPPLDVVIWGFLEKWGPVNEGLRDKMVNAKKFHHEIFES